MMVKVPAVLIVTKSYLTDLAAVPGLPTRASSAPVLCITCYRLQNEAMFNLYLFKGSGLPLPKAFASKAIREYPPIDMIDISSQVILP
jgi:hypothetical protein